MSKKIMMGWLVGLTVMMGFLGYSWLNQKEQVPERVVEQVYVPVCYHKVRCVPHPIYFGPPPPVCHHHPHHHHPHGFVRFSFGY